MKTKITATNTENVMNLIGRSAVFVRSPMKHQTSFAVTHKVDNVGIFVQLVRVPTPTPLRPRPGPVRGGGKE